MPADRSSNEVTPGFLDAFADAWNRHDADAILAMMTPDCVLEFSAGPDVSGRRAVGREEVHRSIVGFFRTMPDARWNAPKHLIAGSRGVTEWVFTATAPDGTRLESQGCDVFTFRDGAIAVKNSYRKQRTA